MSGWMSAEGVLKARTYGELTAACVCAYMTGGSLVYVD